MTRSKSSYTGILFMLVAALCFSIMGGFAKALKASFNAPQLVFYRNITGLLVLLLSFARYPVHQKGGALGLLFVRGLMGTVALYTLLYNILHIPLGISLTYNTTNTLFIALLSYWLLRERLKPVAWLCILLGFGGILLIYQPGGELAWKYHLVGLVCGFSSALAYLSVSKLNRYYDARVIVLSFVLTGVLLPATGMLLGAYTRIPADDFLITHFRLPVNWEWLLIAGLGLFALLGQYFVTLAYSRDKAGIVSAIGYSNIVFSVLIGVFLGDPFPNLVAVAGMLLVIGSGITISMTKK